MLVQWFNASSFACDLEQAEEGMKNTQRKTEKERQRELDWVGFFLFVCYNNEKSKMQEAQNVIVVVILLMKSDQVRVIVKNKS